MTTEEKKAVAADRLARYSNENKIFITADGTPFFSDNHASNHARTLEDKEVVSFSRSDLKIKDVSPQTEQPVKATKADKPVKVEKPAKAEKSEKPAKSEKAKEPTKTEQAGDDEESDGETTDTGGETTTDTEQA